MRCHRIRFRFDEKLHDPEGELRSGGLASPSWSVVVVMGSMLIKNQFRYNHVSFVHAFHLVNGVFMRAEIGHVEFWTTSCTELTKGLSESELHVCLFAKAPGAFIAMVLIAVALGACFDKWLRAGVDKRIDAFHNKYLAQYSGRWWYKAARVLIGDGSRAHRDEI